MVGYFYIILGNVPINSTYYKSLSAWGFPGKGMFKFQIAQQIE